MKKKILIGLLVILLIGIVTFVIIKLNKDSNNNTNNEINNNGVNNVEEETIPEEIATLETVKPATSFAGGNGTKENPYQISNAGELQYFANLFRRENSDSTYKEYQKAYYVLTNDIEINSDDEIENASSKVPTYKWIPIGANDATTVSDKTYVEKFMGTFDGQGHYISGLYSYVVKGEYINNTDKIGLFGEIEEANIKNLTVKNSYLYVKDSVDSVGTIVANAKKSTIENCKVDNVSLYAKSASNLSLLVGNASQTDIANCVVSGNAKGNTQIAGIVSSLRGGTIKNCTNNANLEGLGDNYVGGICSTFSDYKYYEEMANASITNCVNNGNLTAENGKYLGGIIAVAYSGYDNILIDNCKNNVNINVNNSYAGGIVSRLYTEKGSGFNEAGLVGSFTVSNCQNVGNISGDTVSAGIIASITVDKNSSAIVKDCSNAGNIRGAGIISGISSKDGSKLTISKCTNDGEIEVVGNNAGIVGSYDAHNEDGTNGITFEIMNCTNNGNITAPKSIHTFGGIFGFSLFAAHSKNDKFIIDSCTNNGDLISPTVCNLGGIAGVIDRKEGDITISNCKNNGNFNVTVIDYGDSGESGPSVNYVGGITGNASQFTKYISNTNTGKLNIVSGDASLVVFDEVCGKTLE